MKILLYLLLWTIMGFAIVYYLVKKDSKEELELGNKLKKELNYSYDEDDSKIIVREAYVQSTNSRESYEISQNVTNKIYDKFGIFFCIINRCYCMAYSCKLF